MAQRKKHPKRTVSAELGRVGVKCPPNEVEALASGGRVEAFFIYEQGTPGTLCLTHGKEQWLA